MEAALNDFGIAQEEGYLGSRGFAGTNSEVWDYSNLTQVIRTALRENLPVTKKSNINVKKGGGSCVTTIDVTIKLERDKFAKPWREAIKGFSEIAFSYKGCGWSNYGIQQVDGEYRYEVSRRDFFNADESEQSKIIDRFFEWVSRRYMAIGEKSETQQMPKFCLTDEAVQLIEMAEKIVLSFNSDHSNSMVDYFDRAFYEAIYVQWI